MSLIAISVSFVIGFGTGILIARDIFVKRNLVGSATIDQHPEFDDVEVLKLRIDDGPLPLDPSINERLVSRSYLVFKIKT